MQCLASAAAARPKAVESVYELLVELVSDESSEETWRCLAWSQPVYRLFRNPDQVVSTKELFLGEPDQNEDFGRVLYCVGDGRFQEADPATLPETWGEHPPNGQANRQRTDPD